ncbi:hypothetical protein B0H11DRAFT_1952755 [Mycena galericulata]|nr:hypothetical protein B0H11DRAFT_1952755 [Mycena galericulata]
MPKLSPKVTYVNPANGARINLFSPKPTRSDRGVVDHCRSCEKTADELKAQTPPISLMCCKVCMRNGFRVMYCSRDCQTVDWKQGNPPHKAACGKTHVDDLRAVDGSLDSDTLRLYTPTPTAALQAQIEFLARNVKAHYGFRREKNGKYIAHQIQGEGGVLFLQMRKEAMEQRDLASIALMEKILLFSLYPTDQYKGGDYVAQIEREYDVDLEECHRLLTDSARHQALFNAWMDWVRPRIRDDDPSKGVRFQMPWYYLAGRQGEFVHPKYIPWIKEMLKP